MKNYKIELLISFLLIVIAVLGRIVPHPLNFTPLLAVGLFSGHRGIKHFSYAVPLLSLLVSDLLLGFHSTMIYTYGSMMLITYLGASTFLRSGSWINRIVVPSLAGSVVFFLITNFGVWHMEGLYSLDLAGLWQCYLAGIPFFKNTLASTLVFYAGFLAIEKLALKSFLADKSVKN